jgi:hypothetical protein
MPKLNYGFKGNALTAVQAVAAGAVLTSQDYQYTVQLGAVTPLAAPGAPTSVTATVGSGSVVLNWSAPSSAGSSAITGYQITYVADDGTEVTTATSGTSLTITGLTNGTSYAFVVTAVNASAGAGSPASASASPIAYTAPDAPTGVTATRGDGQVVLSWTAPSNNGGTSITGYAITYSGGTITTGNTTYTVTGLTNGTAYNFQVAAVNSVGQGAWSGSVTVTPVSSGPAFSSLSYAITNPNSSQFTSAYQTYSLTGEGLSTLSFSHTFTDAPGNAYEVKVKVYFSLTTAAMIDIPGWLFSGSNYPSVTGIVRPCIASTASHPNFGLDKDGIYRWTLAYSYRSSGSPIPLPMRAALEAGSYFLEYVITEPSSSSVSASVSSQGTYAKTFIQTSGYPAIYQGATTNRVFVYPLSGQFKSLRYSPNTTTTVMAIELASGDSVTLTLSAYDLASGGGSSLVSSGWSYDDKNARYTKVVSGTTTNTLPAMASGRSSAVLGVSGNTTSAIKFTLVS